jgi:hypothetical protein
MQDFMPEPSLRYRMRAPSLERPQFAWWGFNLSWYNIAIMPIKMPLRFSRDEATHGEYTPQRKFRRSDPGRGT